jgi:hypothetical protein
MVGRPSLRIIHRQPSPTLGVDQPAVNGLGRRRFVAAEHIRNVLVVPANGVGHHPLDYSHPRSSNAERWFRGRQSRAITVVRRRMPAAVLTAGRARRAAAARFGPRRAHPRTVAASPYLLVWCPSLDARAQTAWQLRSGSRQTPPVPAASDAGRARHRRRSS